MGTRQKMTVSVLFMFKMLLRFCSSFSSVKFILYLWSFFPFYFSNITYAWTKWDITRLPCNTECWLFKLHVHLFSECWPTHNNGMCQLWNQPPEERREDEWLLQSQCDGARSSSWFISLVFLTQRLNYLFNNYFSNLRLCLNVICSENPIHSLSGDF